MPVGGGKLLPSAREIPVGFGTLGGAAVLVDRLGLAPYADVGIVLPDKFAEMDKTVLLVAPHAVLDVPVQHPESFFGTAHLRRFHHFDIVQVEAVMQGLVAAGTRKIQHGPVGRLGHFYRDGIPAALELFPRKQQGVVDAVMHIGQRIGRAVEGRSGDDAGEAHLEAESVGHRGIRHHIERNADVGNFADGRQHRRLDNASLAVTVHPAGQVPGTFRYAEQIDPGRKAAAVQIFSGTDVRGTHRFPDGGFEGNVAERILAVILEMVTLDGRPLGQGATVEPLFKKDRPFVFRFRFGFRFGGGRFRNRTIFAGCRTGQEKGQRDSRKNR